MSYKQVFVTPNTEMGKISNITNSTDPLAITSRVFVGNLDTCSLTKDDVQSVFQRYGHIVGISMHKGYAFIQYMNELEARNAVIGEDQRIYAGQQIDVNLTAEPKPNRPKRHRPQDAGAEWDYYYNVPFAPGHLPHHIPPPKRPRPNLTSPSLSPCLSPIFSPMLNAAVGSYPTSPLLTAATMPLMDKRHLVSLRANTILSSHKSGSLFQLSPTSRRPEGGSDILICGTCKQMFSDLHKLQSHKESQCKLKFVCRCRSGMSTDSTFDIGKPAPLTCATCHMVLGSAWELCQHCQTVHGLKIYNTQQVVNGGIISRSYEQLESSSSKGLNHTSECSSSDITQDTTTLRQSDHCPVSVNGITMPVNGITMPVNGITMPVNGITMPAIGITTPANGITTPANGITTPANGITMPANGITMPANGITMPANGITLPVNGDLA